MSIEAKSKDRGRYEAYTDNGRERTGVDVFDWAERAVDLGAGELLVTSIDNEGTGAGYDVELISTISRAVPVLACGGAGALQHSSLVQENQIFRACQDRNEICLCHEERCPNCDSCNIHGEQLTEYDEDDLDSRIRCEFRFKNIQTK